MQCSRSCGGGNQFRDVTCLDNKGQVSKECHSKNKPYYYQRCNNTPCPTTAGNAPRRQNCRDTYTGNVCMYVVQANFCQFSSYRRMCCNSCARHWNEDQNCLVCKSCSCPSNDWSSTHLWNRFTAGSGRDYIYRMMMIQNLWKRKDSSCKCSFEPCQTRALNKAVVTVEASGHGTHQQLHILQRSAFKQKDWNQSAIYSYKSIRSGWKTFWPRSQVWT